jgi:hypothetical protein
MTPAARKVVMRFFASFDLGRVEGLPGSTKSKFKKKSSFKINLCINVSPDYKLFLTRKIKVTMLKIKIYLHRILNLWRNNAIKIFSYVH